MKLAFKRLLAYLPTKLPLGMAEYEQFVKDIRSLLDSRLDALPDDDISFVIAANITHGGPTVDRLPKQRFVRVINAAAAKQVAGQAFQDIKKRQLAASEAAKLKQAEDTAAETAQSVQAQN